VPRVQGAARWRVAVPGKRHLGRFWRKLGGVDGVKGLHIQYFFTKIFDARATTRGTRNACGMWAPRAPRCRCMRPRAETTSIWQILGKSEVNEWGRRASFARSLRARAVSDSMGYVWDTVRVPAVSAPHSVPPAPPHAQRGGGQRPLTPVVPATGKRRRAGANARCPVVGGLPGRRHWSSERSNRRRWPPATRATCSQPVERPVYLQTPGPFWNASSDEISKIRPAGAQRGGGGCENFYISGR
jgi:hypothetical protein